MQIFSTDHIMNDEEDDESSAANNLEFVWYKASLFSEKIAIVSRHQKVHEKHI